MAKIIRLTESDVHRIVKESVERIMKDAGFKSNLDEEAGAGGGGATNAAGVMQGGGTNPEAGQYTVPAFGVQRRKIYSPKDPTLKRHNGKGGSISIPKERE